MYYSAYLYLRNTERDKEKRQNLLFNHFQIEMSKKCIIIIYFHDEIDLKFLFVTVDSCHANFIVFKLHFQIFTKIFLRQIFYQDIRLR